MTFGFMGWATRWGIVGGGGGLIRKILLSNLCNLHTDDRDHNYCIEVVHIQDIAYVDVCLHHKEEVDIPM
jgi:hypothetical protein